MKKLESSIRAILQICQMQWATLLMVAQLSLSQIRDRKKSFLARLNKTYSTAVLPVVEKVLHFLLIRYVIVTILIIVVFFSVVHSMN